MQISKEKILEFYRIANGNQEVFEALIKAYADGQEASPAEVTVAPYVLPAEPPPINPLNPSAPYPWEIHERPLWQQPVILETPDYLRPPWTITCRA